MPTWSWNLKQLRELIGFSQQAVADGSGLGHTTIWRLEKEPHEGGREGKHGIRGLVLLYRFFWRLGERSFDGPTAPVRQVQLCDIIHAPGVPPCSGRAWSAPPPVQPVNELPGVWWNLQPLRMERNADPGRPHIYITDVAAAVGQTLDNLSKVESKGGAGSIALMLRATRYFSEQLRPMGIDEVLRVDPTVRNEARYAE